MLSIKLLLFFIKIGLITFFLVTLCRSFDDDKDIFDKDETNSLNKWTKTNEQVINIYF